MLLLLCFLLTASIEQPPQEKITYAIYNIEIRSFIPINFSSKSGDTTNPAYRELVQAFSDSVQKNGIVVGFTENVTVYADSSVVQTKYSEQDDRQISYHRLNIRIKGNPKKKILKDNLYYLEEITGEQNVVADGYEEFYETSETAVILNYKTTVYKNKSGSQKIWVSKKLSPLLNPGVKIINPVGGILKAEKTENQQIRTSLLRSLYTE